MPKLLLTITVLFAATFSIAIGFAVIAPAAHAGGPCDPRLQTC